eukprot:GSMAST32.ASY1.ANO1.2398.1 assembled CDS
MPESVSGTYSMSDAANGSLSSPIATSLQVSDDDCSRTDPERDCLEPEITASSESECNRSNVHDYSSNSEVDVDCGIEEDRKWFSWRLLLAYSGPGWLMSIAYLDPGNIESDLQAGAYSGYHCVWVLFWCHVLGLVLQTLSARLGVVTGKNLAQICRKEYSRPVSIGLWLMTELAIIGSDIQEVVGSAIAFKVLFKLDLWIGSIHYFGVKKLEYFFGVLILVMLISFWVVCFIFFSNSFFFSYEILYLTIFF